MCSKNKKFRKVKTINNLKLREKWKVWDRWHKISTKMTGEHSHKKKRMTGEHLRDEHLIYSASRWKWLVKQWRSTWRFLLRRSSSRSDRATHVHHFQDVINYSSHPSLWVKSNSSHPSLWAKSNSSHPSLWVKANSQLILEFEEPDLRYQPNRYTSSIFFLHPG